MGGATSTIGADALAASAPRGPTVTFAPGGVTTIAPYRPTRGPLIGSAWSRTIAVVVGKPLDARRLIGLRRPAILCELFGALQHVQEQAEMRRFAELNRQYIARSLKLVRVQGLFEPLLEAITPPK